MIDPRAVLIAAAIALTIWIGGETIKGVRWVKHHIQAAAHHLVHPHDKGGHGSITNGEVR